MFIWTISDALGVIFWGLVLLFFAGMFAWLGIGFLIEKGRRKFRQTQKAWTVDRDGRVKTEKDRPVELRSKELCGND